MRLNRGTRPGRLRRLALSMTPAAALAMTLAACSGSAGPSTSQPPAQQGSSQPAAAPSSSSAAPAAAADSGLSGRWSGQYGGAYHGTFKLHWHQSGARLSGAITISNPGQTMSIHGKEVGGSIQFGTVGSLAITYSGSVSGNSMSGNYQVNGGGNSSGGPWSASKS